MHSPPLCPSFADAQELSPVEQQVLKQLEELRRGLEDGLQNQDVEKILTFAHPEMVVTWQNAQVSRGVKEVRQYLERMLVGENSIVKRITVKPLVVEGRYILGNLILSQGTMIDEFELRENNLHFTLTSRFSAWLSCENNGCLLRGLHLSANVFDNPIQDTIVKRTKLYFGLIGLGVGVLLGFLIRKRIRANGLR